MLRLHPDDGAGYQALAFVLREKGDVDGAAKAFHKAEILNEARMKIQAANLATETAARLLRDGDVPGALGKLRFAVQLAPDSSVAHFQLGLALRRNGDLKQAQAQFERARQLDPQIRIPRE